MATGASAAKREAAKQAQAAYFEALSKAERLKNVRNIDNNSAIKLEDELGDNLSYGSKRLAMQADKIAKKINKDDTMQEGIGRFNKRYDEIKRQMNGEKITKFEKVEKRTFQPGLLSDTTNISTQSGFGKFDTKEEAENFTPQPQASNNKDFKGITNAPNGLLSIAGLDNKQPAYEVRQADLAPINSNYRTISQTAAAYNDLATLSKDLSSNPVNKYAQSYESIAQKLKGRLRREVDNVPKINLNNADVLSGSVTQEVIR